MRESDKYDIFNPENHTQDCELCPKCDMPMIDGWSEKIDYCEACDCCEMCQYLYEDCDCTD